jgi:pantoate--beta-alanine ligase
MRTIQTIAELRQALALVRQQNKRVGFVPTMGALHEGHLSLVRMSKQQVDVTVVSIFVNPTQFGQNEDFGAYPRPVESDVSKLVDAEVDFLFMPAAAEIYPKGHSTSVVVGDVTELYEGAIRPGHFQGVTTVVAILLNIVQPHVAFFGQKDAQQVAVIKRMVVDLQMPVDIVVGETIREQGRLAMSSRNVYLSDSQRLESEALSSALTAVRESLLLSEEIRRAKEAGIRVFESIAPHGKLDYLDIVHSETFHPIASFEPNSIGNDANRQGETPITIIMAARFGSTRLIDNMTV